MGPAGLRVPRSFEQKTTADLSTTLRSGRDDKFVMWGERSHGRGSCLISSRRLAYGWLERHEQIRTKRDGDGCPTFAPAYVGRRRRAQPLHTF
jgi:hypothetical protein